MLHNHFFFGSGKLTIWYFLFYLLGLPIYILGIYLFMQLRPGQGPQGGEFVLSILSIGYLLLGFFSMINAVLYMQKTHRYFFGSAIFLGVQIAFWIIGYGLGNNYPALFIFFIASLGLTIYLNLKALWYFQQKDPSLHKKLHTK